jgi:hypothetical protein
MEIGGFMKRVVIAAVAVAIVLVGYLAAGPFIVMHQIQSALAQRDSEALSTHVDFPTLRTNLKEQINVLVMKNAAHDLQDNPLGAFGMALASRVAESMVDALVTPAGLASLMTGTRPRKTDSGAGTPSPNEDHGTPFKHARYSYDSDSKFSAFVKGPQGNGDAVRIVFTRDGLSWKLSNIVIPPALFDDGKTASGQTGSPGP